MAKFYASKIVSSLPSPLEANTLYLIRTGTGFDLYCSDSTGSIAHKLNPSGIQGPATSVAGNVAVFDNTTGNLVNDRATTVNLRSTSDGTATLGPEMVTNGYFNSGSTGWTLGNGWTMVDGKPTLDLAVASPGTLSTNITAEVYQAYRLASSVTMTNPEFGFIEISLGSNRKTFTSSQSQFFLLTGPATAGTIAIVFTPTIDAGSTGTIKVDNLSCKQITAVPAAARIDDGSHRTDFRQYRGSINIGNGGAYRTGSDVLNVSIGMDAAGLGISNSNSVFVGNSAGSQASSVWECTLVGYAAGSANLGNFNNTLVGAFCGQSFWSGDYNTAIGHSALGSSRSGSNNSALGVESGYKTGTSLYIKIPTNCTYIGASTKASTVIPINETVLGANAIGAGNNTVQLGDPNVTLVQTSGQLKAVLSYTNTSSDAPNLTIDSFGNIKRSTASLSGLPDQTGQEGKFLFTDGTNPSWQNAGEGVPVGGTTNQVLAKASNTDFDTAWVNPSDGSSLPDVAGNSGKFLSNDGTDLLWGVPDGTLPSPAGNSGKYLTTDGTNVFWDTVPGGSIAPGTIQYFADDPGAGWLKGDGSTYLRASYSDLSAARPINLLNCPLLFNKITIDAPTQPSSISNIDSDGVFFVVENGWGGLGSGYFYKYSETSVTRLFKLPSGAPAGGGYGARAAASGHNHKYWAFFTGVDALKWGKLSGDSSFSWLPQPDDVATGTVSRGCCSWNSDGTKLALAAGDGMWLYSRSGDTLTLVHTQAATSTEQVNEIAWSSDDAYIALATTGGSSNRPLRVYKVGVSSFDEISSTPTGVSSGPANYTISFIANSKIVLAGGSESYRDTYGAAMFDVTSNGMNQLHTLWKYTSDNARFATHPALPILIECADATPRMRIHEMGGNNMAIPNLLDMSPSNITSRFDWSTINYQGNVCIATSNGGPQTMVCMVADSTKIRLPLAIQNGLQGWIKT